MRRLQAFLSEGLETDSRGLEDLAVFFTALRVEQNLCNTEIAFLLRRFTRADQEVRVAFVDRLCSFEAFDRYLAQRKRQERQAA